MCIVVKPMKFALELFVILKIGLTHVAFGLEFYNYVVLYLKTFVSHNYLNERYRYKKFSDNPFWTLESRYTF